MDDPDVDFDFDFDLGFDFDPDSLALVLEFLAFFACLAFLSMVGGAE